MAETLYLLETRAAKQYVCPACRALIPRGAQHFRHDPPPYTTSYRGLKHSHWCLSCVNGLGVEKEAITRRIRVASTALLTRLHVPLVEVVDAGAAIARAILADPSILNAISPEGLEALVCDRLFEWGFEPKRTGNINRKDGGLDILFWPRLAGAFPLLGGVQVKASNKGKKVGSPPVRDFESVVRRHSLGVGLLVTNTGFTPDAEWFAKTPSLLHLRGFADLVRWARNEFESPEEWREFPDELVLCPGVTIKLR